MVRSRINGLVISPTPPETFQLAKAPENGCLEYDPASYWVSAYFQGRTVSFRMFQGGYL